MKIALKEAKSFPDLSKLKVKERQLLQIASLARTEITISYIEEHLRVDNFTAHSLVSSLINEGLLMQAEKNGIDCLEFVDIQLKETIQNNLTKDPVYHYLLNQLKEIEENQKKSKRLQIHDEKILHYCKRYPEIIGQSAAIIKIFELLDKVSDNHFSVLITGESGTGKELVARAIHVNSHRHNNRFVSENCAAFSKTLIESELFGYVKGAFSGADRDKMGLFEIANGGTLFLDEIGDMDVELQKKLLRVLQEGEVRPIGSKHVIKVDVRIIAATNKDLQALIEKEKFREDLYYRLNVIKIEMPPLRERIEDIPSLVDYFFNKFNPNQYENPRSITQEVLRAFVKYNWPGNIRELENEMRKIIALGEHVIQIDTISPQIVRKPLAKITTNDLAIGGNAMRDVLDAFEKQIIKNTLKETHQNKAMAAKTLGITRKTLYEKLYKYGLLEE